jgi:hypothetical protein
LKKTILLYFRYLKYREAGGKMRNNVTNFDIETNDLTWIQKMIAGPEDVDGLDWIDEDELTGEEITDIKQLEVFGVTDQSLKEFKKSNM